MEAAEAGLFFAEKFPDAEIFHASSVKTTIPP